LLADFPFLSYGNSFFGIDNPDLERLNAAFDLGELGDRVKIFAGNGQKTIYNINVGKKKENSMYPDGAPKSADKYDDGDGTVPLTSAHIGSIEVDHSENSGHGALIKNYRGKIIKFIFDVAAGAGPSTLTTKDALGETATAQLSISLQGAVTPCVTVPGGGKAGIDPATGELVNTASGASLDMDSVAAGIVIASPADGVYTVQVKGSHERDYRVEISYMGTDQSTAMVSAIGFNHADTQAFTFTLDAGAENKLLLGMNPVPPGNLLADPYDSGGLKTRLSWDASEDPEVVSYNVYSREETEPFMALLGSSADAFLQTSHPWAENSTVPTRFYAVAAVKADGTEGFLSEWAKNNDRDHDGLSDEEETAFGSDMTRADTDGDGLQDGEEYLHGTSPVLLDTDGDGYNDYVEVQAGSDPLDKESLPSGSLTVTITPQAAIDAGAKWRVDGGAWQESGSSLSNLTIGEHEVEFQAPAGWVKPSNKTVEISANQGVQITETFSLSNPPSVSTFSINNGASSTTGRTVTLNNTCKGNPTQYMASESSSFTGATWQTYSTAPSFTISAGNGVKTVHFRVRSDLGQSLPAVDTITLNEPTIPVVTVTAADASAAEPVANTGAFRFTRTGSTSASLTVRYGIGGTAVNGTDYTG
jgi:hypothetical protein